MMMVCDEVSDKYKKTTWKSYHKKLLNKAFEWE